MSGFAAMAGGTCPMAALRSRADEVEQRVSLITLGVADMAASAAFYRALGWRDVGGPDGVVAFDMIGQTLGLYPKAALAAEFGGDAASFGGGIVLSHNLRSKAEVDGLVDQARSIGARILTSPKETTWGGYHGHFADPDGHIWEIAYNPFSPLGPNGEFQWGGA